jgi:hypothetical protein
LKTRMFHLNVLIEPNIKAFTYLIAKLAFSLI